jgi:hypothetical protein
LRKRMVALRSKGGGVRVDGLRKRMTAARSEAGVKAAACSGTGDEVVACSGAGIKDGRWQQQHVYF